MITKPAAVRRTAGRAFALALLPVAINSHAVQFDFENGNTLSWDNYVTYGAQYRVQGPDHDLVRAKEFDVVQPGVGNPQFNSDLTASIKNPEAAFTNFVNAVRIAEDESLKINTDDGNLNFASGMTSSKVTWISELDFKGTVGDVEYGAFLRAKAYYDQVYAERSTDMNARNYWRYNAGKESYVGPFNDPVNNPTIYRGGVLGWGFLDQTGQASLGGQGCTADQKATQAACHLGAFGWGGNADIGELPEDTRDELGSKAEFLDAFVYTNFQVGDQRLALRVGRQVINLGESNFFPGLMGMVNSLNAYDSHQPGVEVKELLLPTGAIDLKWSVNSEISLEGYYQYEWKPHYLDPAGSFFSMTDMLGAGAQTLGVVQRYWPSAASLDPTDPNNIGVNPADPANQGLNNPAIPYTMLGFVPKTKDDDPSQSGQWGIGGHYMFEDGSDIGLYHVVYHSKIPSLVINPAKEPLQVPLANGCSDDGVLAGYGLDLNVPNGPTRVPAEVACREAFDHYTYLPESYTIRHFDNIRTYGMSFSTNVGEVNVFGEYTWTANAPVVTSNKYAKAPTPELAVPEFNTPKRVPINQVNLGILHVLGANILSDQINLIAETGIVQYQGISNRDVKYDNHGWGLAMRMDNNFYSVAPGIDLVVPFSFQIGLDGTIREQNIIEDAKVLGIGLTMIYLGKFEMGMMYSTYFGAGADHWVNDRDNISFNVKYSM